MAYYSLDPFGEVRGDLQAGIVASTIANVNKGKNGRAFTPDDFMPLIKKPDQSEGDMLAQMEAIARGK